MSHSLRAAHDAVLVGIGTVLADNPQLTVRLASGPNPTRVVMDSHLRLPLDSAVMDSNGAQIKIVTLEPSASGRAEEIRELGGDVVTVPGLHGRIDLAAALDALHEFGIQSVLVEGGAQIMTEFIRRRLADELVLFIAPKIIGSGIDAVGDLGVSDMTEAVRFSSSVIRDLDGDILFRGKPIWPP